MIPQFPEFTPVDFKLQKEIQTFTRKFDPYEDFSFVNLYTWDTNGNAGVSWLNNNLVIKIPNYMDSTKFTYTFVGTSQLDATVTTLLDKYRVLELIPTFAITGLLHPEKYAIAEDRDSFDYMYSVKSLSEMTGGPLRKKRNLVNATHKALGERIQCVTVSKLSSEQRLDVEVIIERWFNDTKQPSEDVACEKTALSRLIDAFEQLDLWITLCYIDDNLNGFSVHEIISKDYSICHFEKSLNKKYPGINTVLIKAAATFLSDKSATVNWQQDLGIEGLRKSKEAYRPKYYLRKYWISRGVN